MTFPRVLVAIDPSEPRRDILEQALALCRPCHGELIAVEAASRAHASGWRSRDQRAFVAELRRRADEAGAELAYSVEAGDPAQAILHHARSLNPGVIVAVDDRHPDSHRRRLGGSVVERVMAGASVPVLVLPRNRHAARVRPFKHVAVAVGFGASSERAINCALSLASGPSDCVTLLHAVRPVTTRRSSNDYQVGIVTCQDLLLRDDQDWLMREAMRRLRRAVPRRRWTGTVEARVLLGEATTAIAGAVERLDPDLLVVGVSRRNAISRALFGFSAARLLQATSIPMLAVPQAPPTAGEAEHRRLQPAA